MNEATARRNSVPPLPEEERCLCGNLLARLMPGGVEILCRRCKRKHVIRWTEQHSEQENPADRHWNQN